MSPQVILKNILLSFIIYLPNFLKVKIKEAVLKWSRIKYQMSMLKILMAINMKPNFHNHKNGRLNLYKTFTILRTADSRALK